MILLWIVHRVEKITGRKTINQNLQELIQQVKQLKLIKTLKVIKTSI